MTHFMTQFAEKLGADFHRRSSVAEDVFGWDIPELSGGVVDKVFVAHCSRSSLCALRSSLFALRSSLHTPSRTGQTPMLRIARAPKVFLGMCFEDRR